jgi:malonate-semialdehyde dehydrogenase (acetylating) / methylmalonate-semialdehyde dehydrogenase
MRRGIENVEVATACRPLMQGWNNEDIARGIDEHLFRQPLGVVGGHHAVQLPGHDPALVPPLRHRGRQLLRPQALRARAHDHPAPVAAVPGGRLPAGVVSLVNGGKETVDALLDHPLVRAVSFVGSTPVARYIYARATANGKRAQCQGGAKNPAIVMPDADMDMSDAHPRRQRLRLRGPALPRHRGRDHRRRRPADPSPSASSTMRTRAGSASASTRACRWARSSAPRAGSASPG